MILSRMLGLPFRRLTDLILRYNTRRSTNVCFVMSLKILERIKSDSIRLKGHTFQIQPHSRVSAHVQIRRFACSESYSGRDQHSSNTGRDEQVVGSPALLPRLAAFSIFRAVSSHVRRYSCMLLYSRWIMCRHLGDRRSIYQIASICQSRDPIWTLGGRSSPLALFHEEEVDVQSANLHDRKHKDFI